MSPARHLPLLLAVWREVGRHLEIGEFLEALMPRLREHADVRWLWVLELDLVRHRAVPLAEIGGVPRDRSAVGLGDATAVRGLAEALREGPDSKPVRDALRQLGLRSTRGVWVGPIDHGASPSALIAGIGPDADPSLLEDLLEPFAAAIANHRRLHELARLRETVEADNRALLSRLERQDITATIVGERAGLRAVMTRVDQVAATDAPVLLLGETGSGKEVVARAIHLRSNRRDGPFLRVNCGAIPSELIDSELFGHERGSFTGAVATRRGWFERADGGTLFLDELGELPQAAQVRLLRVLQDGTFERVGGQRPMRADVRLVAATHRDMHDLLTERRFREDLWYRVAVFPIQLPALRDRMEDVAELAAHFAASAGRRLRGVPLVPSSEDIRSMLGYSWPGNVRELAAVIERAAILGDGRRLEIQRALGAQLPTRAPRARSLRTLEDALRDAIIEGLTHCAGRIEGPGGAAELLGEAPSTLRSRMDRLGLRWQDYRAESTS
jgi:transcriptional regulator with GAF, ATPase, and Fis domain